MTTTGPGSAHRHKTKSGVWYDLTDTASGSPHTHAVTETAHPADALTGDQVKTLLLLAQGGGGGTTPPTPVTPPPPGPDTTPPVISGVNVIEIAQTSVKVVWSLSEPATGQVEYGLTAAYGSTTTAETSFTYSAHAQVISGLTAGTTYHFLHVDGLTVTGNTQPLTSGALVTAGDCTAATTSPNP